MKRTIRLIVFLILFSVIVIPNFAKERYKSKNIIVRKTTKKLVLKKNSKGKIIYFLPKGRYKVIVSPNDTDYLDSYIMGESEEFNPDMIGNNFQYEIDTKKSIESFYQEYKVNKNTKLKIQIEKIE